MTTRCDYQNFPSNILQNAHVGSIMRCAQPFHLLLQELDHDHGHVDSHSKCCELREAPDSIPATMLSRELALMGSICKPTGPVHQLMQRLLWFYPPDEDI